MRKLIIYILILILFSFLIPILFTNKFGDSKQTFSKIENIDNKLCIVVEQITYLSNGDFNYRGS